MEEVCTIKEFVATKKTPTGTATRLGMDTQLGLDGVEKEDSDNF